MVDERHYNHWEEWVKTACQVEEFSSFNTLWLSYFIAGAAVGSQATPYVFKQVLHTVYTSLPDLIGVLFLSRKCSPSPPALILSFLAHPLSRSSFKL